MFVPKETLTDQSVSGGLVFIGRSGPVNQLGVSSVSTSKSQNRQSVLRTIVPALLVLGLMGALPNWVTIAEAEGYAPPAEAQGAGAAFFGNPVTGSSSALGMAMGGGGSGGGSSDSAGGFRIKGIKLGGVQLDGTYFTDEDSAAGGKATGQLGGFLTAVGGFGDVTSTLDFTNGGLIGGIDYQFSEDLLGGLSINWITSSLDFANDGGGSDSDTYGASLYTRYSPGQLSIDGLFNYSFSDYANTRATADPGTPFVTGTNNSDQIFLSAGVSYDFELAGLKIGPAVRASLAQLWMDGYSETGGGAVNTAYEAYDITSFTTDLGANVSYAIKTSAGLLTPRISGFWVHEYANDSQILYFKDIGGPNNNILQGAALANPDRNYFRVGAGVSMELQEDGLEIYFDYQSILGFDDLNAHQFSAGGHWDF